jgi:sec-independent protein translocase protein TatA
LEGFFVYLTVCTQYPRVFWENSVTLCNIFLKNKKMILQILSGGHIILILAVVLLLFGGKKIPELMKGLGQGVKEFKDASKAEDTSKEAAKPTEEKN